VGLILNELISNALKYAFEDNGTGKLNVRFSKREDEYTLQVADSGKGLPTDFNAIGSMGMRLVNVLTEQLNGLIDVRNEAGATFTIRFKKAVAY
jgi:two-component sensor histidine kinase